MKVVLFWICLCVVCIGVVGYEFCRGELSVVYFGYVC